MDDLFRRVAKYMTRWCTSNLSADPCHNLDVKKKKKKKIPSCQTTILDMVTENIPNKGSKDDNNLGSYFLLSHMNVLCHLSKNYLNSNDWNLSR